MSLIATLLCLLLTQAPPGDPVLRLRASSPQPYIGQELTLTLEIELTTTAAGAAELSIPWRTREFGFSWSMPPAEWLRQQSERKTGLPLLLPQDRMAVRAVPMASDSGEKQQRYSLEWQLVVHEPDTLNRGAIVFAPVRLKLGQKEVVSNSLTLERRRLPLMPADMTGYFLGVGDLQLTVELPAKAVVNEAAPLTLRVSGRGPVSRVPRPAPGELWGTSSTSPFRVEFVKELQGTGAKDFQYLAYPRRSGTVTLPAIRTVCFDPDRGQYVARTAGPWSIHVQAAASGARPGLESTPYAPAEIPERFRPVPIPPHAFQRPQPYVVYLIACFYLATPPLLALLMRRLVRRRNRGLASGSEAARRAIRELEKLGPMPSAEHVEEILFCYLRSRFPLQSGEVTPVDIARDLAAAGVDAALVRRAHDLLVAVDAARFGVMPLQPSQMQGLVELIHELESARSCA
jgi:hypothetical protein